MAARFYIIYYDCKPDTTGRSAEDLRCFQSRHMLSQVLWGCICSSQMRPLLFQKLQLMQAPVSTSSSWYYAQDSALPLGPVDSGLQHDKGDTLPGN